MEELNFAKNVQHHIFYQRIVKCAYLIVKMNKVIYLELSNNKIYI